MKNKIFGLALCLLLQTNIIALPNKAFADTTSSGATAPVTPIPSPTAASVPTPTPTATPTWTPTPTPASSPTATQTSTPTPTSPPIPPLIQKIQSAKAMLAQTVLNYVLSPHYKLIKIKKAAKSRSKSTAKSGAIQTSDSKNGIITGYSLDAKDIALAIFNPATDKIDITKGQQSGKTFSFDDKNFDIKTLFFNGVNSHFLVKKPANGVVLAVKYLITNPESGSKASILAGMQPVTYVPYSTSLDTPDVAAYGGQYLDSVIKQVAIQLNKVESRSVPGQNLTIAIKPSIIKALLYAEHMDTNEFIYNPNTQSLINKINVLYAGNEGDTFKYAVSSSNARGIAQFIPSTYEALATRHPEAGLISDFVAGMSDHINAVKAEYLLIDDYTAAVQTRVAQQFIPGYSYDYGAASYNGGVSRVAKAVMTFGKDWWTDHSQAINDLQNQFDNQTAVVRQLKAKLKSASKTQKNALKSEVALANTKAEALSSELADYKSSALRNETVLYLEKMHRLIQIFNS